ncbi:MAG: translocation protein TolB, partial [Raineya sp.]
MKAFLTSIFLLIGINLYAQVEGITQRPFGKNRVQFKEFDWRMKTTNNFEVYYYDFGSGIADFALLYAENEFDRIATLLGHNPAAKTKLFIYNSVTDLQQSNVGLENENSRTVGGQTNFIKPKIEIPFAGSLAEFKKELSFGIAQIFVNEMMYGGIIREILKNGALLTLPEWFMPGVAAYVAEPWSSEMDDYMRNNIQYRSTRRPHKLTGKEAMLAGQSIWNYIGMRYGESNIASILNLTRIVRDEKEAIASTLGLPFDD